MTATPGGRALVIAGHILTLAPAGRGDPATVEAIALAGDRVIAAGSLEAVRAAVPRGTPAWHAGPDAAIIPGITDAHLHLVSAALAAEQPDLTGLGRQAALERLAEAHARLEAQGRHDDWLLGHGWSMDAFGGWPTAGDLALAAPGRPAALWAHDHHSRWVSSAALALAGIDASTPDPPRGTIVRDADGAPRGTLHEGAAGLIDRAIPRPRPGDAERAVVALAAHLAMLGVTGVHDPGELAPDPGMAHGPRLYRRLAAEGRLPLRVAASIRREQIEAAADLGVRTGSGLPVPTGAAVDAPLSLARYRDGWLKLFADGALGTRSAWLLEPYEADPGTEPLGSPHGMPLLEAGELADLARRAGAAGIRLQVHALGDAAVRRVLDVLEALPVSEPSGTSTSRAWHRIEHVQLVHPADIGRFAAARVAASVQACHLLSDAAAARRAWGSRTSWAFALRSLLEAGALLASGTDAPVEPPDPWPGLAAAVARRGADDPPEAAFHPGQAIDLADALRAACTGGPRSLGIADEGHLGPGARADLQVVPRAALEGPFLGAGSGGPVRALATCRPLATVIDGRAVHVLPGLDLPDGLAPA